MIEHELVTCYARWFDHAARIEKSVIVFGAMEATLTPLMERIEQEHPGVKVFSLPSVDHPVYGRHIELGVKGRAEAVAGAWVDLIAGLTEFGAGLGPEMVR
jgi:molybdopterin-biosynthesis enzyme MoeA-like protein